MEAEYQLSTELPKAELRRALVPASVLMLLALVVGVFGMQPAGTSTSRLWLCFVVALPIAGIALYIGLRSNRITWKSFRLIISADSLTRRIQGLPDLIVRKDEITKITRLTDHGLTVHTRDRFRQLYISDKLQGYVEVQEKLATWAPIEQLPPRRVSPTLQLAAGSAVLLLMLVSARAEDLRILVPVNIALAVTLSTSIYPTWRSAHIARGHKWLMLLLIPSILSLIARIWTKG